MRKCYLFGLIGLAAVLISLAGCGSSDNVLAVIGDYEITVDEFENFFKSLHDGVQWGVRQMGGALENQ